MIARFLLTRKGLSRWAIGEYLGETKDELANATLRCDVLRDPAAADTDEQIV
ncbi:unnamed protein product [Protopolystoma xenopodis]|uniref:Uncharacterized protein n=1 Tax=Protopolystoma xenopodis TaxID=117903 RepID=A0A448X449_9PLAT|nr:unnamed protein product [Protopolystoma xenopodis]